MNADRRYAAQLCVSLIQECAEVGEMSEAAHDTLLKTVKHLRQAEFWQLRNQERHAGKNTTTDKQLAICRVALPALELAEEAVLQEDFGEVITQLSLAITTDGKPPRKSRRKRG